MNTRVTYYVAISLDGFIATVDGGVEWLAAFQSDGEDYGYTSFYESVDGLVMGSRTFEQVLGFGVWPYPGKLGWVCTSREFGGLLEGVQTTSKDPMAMLDELAERGVQNAWLIGGARLATSFHAKGKIHRFILTVMPVLLGKGIPMLEASGTIKQLELVGSTQFPNGVIQLEYLAKDD
jgi:dihydrofolate reductase